MRDIERSVKVVVSGGWVMLSLPPTHNPLICLLCRSATPPCSSGSTWVPCWCTPPSTSCPSSSTQASSETCRAAGAGRAGWKGWLGAGRQRGEEEPPCTHRPLFTLPFMCTCLLCAGPPRSLGKLVSAPGAGLHSAPAVPPNQPALPPPTPCAGPPRSHWCSTWRWPTGASTT